VIPAGKVVVTRTGELSPPPVDETLGLTVYIAAEPCSGTAVETLDAAVSTGTGPLRVCTSRLLTSCTSVLPPVEATQPYVSL
jgi:hypothetical protein